MLQAQPPIVVDVIKQPPVSPEITMGDVILSAFGLTGVIMVSALLAGILVGAVIIAVKKRRERQAIATSAQSTLRL
jgi:hypothetical protein